MSDAEKSFENVKKVFSAVNDYASELNEVSQGSSPIDDPWFKRGTSALVAAGSAAVFLQTGSVGAAGVTSAVTRAAVSSYSAVYKGLDHLVMKHRAKRPDYNYHKFWQDVQLDTQRDGGINNIATFSLGSGEESLYDVPVRLKSGYHSTVNMVVDKGSRYYYDGYNPTMSDPERRLFEVADSLEFRKLNGHMDANENSRKNYYLNEGHNEEEAGILEQYTENVYGGLNKNFIEELKARAEGDPNVHLDVAGAPYYYDTKTNQYSPSIARYSGDSLKDLIRYAEESSVRAGVGSGNGRKFDMIDLTYAHGRHSQDVRRNVKGLTKPVYQKPEEFDEAYTGKTRFDQFKHFMRASVSGVKTYWEKVKEKGGKLVDKFRKQTDAQMDEMTDAAITAFKFEPSELAVREDVRVETENGKLSDAELLLHKILHKGKSTNDLAINKSRQVSFRDPEAAPHSTMVVE